jgi:hypothetical protein
LAGFNMSAPYPHLAETAMVFVIARERHEPLKVVGGPNMIHTSIILASVIGLTSDGVADEPFKMSLENAHRLQGWRFTRSGQSFVGERP